MIANRKTQRRLVVKRIPEYGWGIFWSASTDKAVGDELGPWWTSRKKALAARESLAADEVDWSGEYA